MSAPTPSALTEAQIYDIRRRGWRGGIITPHRAFARLLFTAREFWITLGSVLSISAAWLLSLRYVGELWFHVFRFWHRMLGLEGSVARAPQHWGPIQFSVPTVLISAGPPDAVTWWTTAAVTLLILWTTFGIPEEQLPFVYLLRFLVIIQGTALAYFAVAAAKFPHDLPSYIVGMLHFGTIFITLLPLILGFSYFLFDFRLPQKIGLTVGIMAYLVIFLPFQYMLHVWIIHNSILFMPMLYFVFGPFLDVLIFVSLYSWGMSWQSLDET
ncbi:MAG: hypothetical protein DMG61_22775 [Acidobacteria bacterium]|nr:MAG: hypothetical protein DMG61_22775 [Acidobacteriota bacterium]PYY20368.1 MAG: hypothetical protein DMG60_00260 [Acidobacteriota bacterium]